MKLSGEYAIFICILFVGVLFIISFLKNKNKSKPIVALLKQYGFTMSELTPFECRYVGGHSERDLEAQGHTFIGVKDGTLVFFECKNYVFIENNTKILTLSNAKNILNMIDKISYDTIPINNSMNIGIVKETIFNYLFSIKIGNIKDIRYFDATTSSIVAGVGTSIGGIGVGIPIRMKQGDASVLIDWSDGKFSNSTEFRFQSKNANSQANSMRNTLIRMAK